MKLSMAVIADKLGQYAPELYAATPDMELTGVRMLSAAGRIRQDVLYVISGAECFGSGELAETVLCFHKRSCMLLHSDDPAEVLGAVQDIFEAFDRWEADLRDTGTQGRDMQHLIDVSRYALPYPIYITDFFGNTIAYSREYPAGSVSRAWDAALLRAGQSISVPEGEAAPEEIPDGSLILQLRQGGEYVGIIAFLEQDAPFSEGVAPLAELFCNAASEAVTTRGAEAELRTMVSLARDYFDGKPVDIRRLWERICRICARNAEDMEMIVIESLEPSDAGFRSGMTQKLASCGVPCFGLSYQESILMLLCCENENEFLSRVRSILSGYLYVCGVSLPFGEADELRSAMGQANLALRSGSRGTGDVNKCVDHVYDYLLSALAGENSLASGLEHPALENLRKYDRQHQTELYRTLYVYLCKERNVVAAAKALFIHRNSMLYRLQRIDQLLGLDLEDVDLRMYLLLSYQIAAARGGENNGRPL